MQHKGPVREKKTRPYIAYETRQSYTTHHVLDPILCRALTENWRKKSAQREKNATTKQLASEMTTDTQTATQVAYGKRTYRLFMAISGCQRASQPDARPPESEDHRSMPVFFM